MEIQKQCVTQIIIVDYDEIPLEKLIHSPNLETLAKSYDFKGTQIGTDPAGNIVQVQYRHGLFKEDVGEFTIDRLEVQERKMLFKLDASSQEADRFYASLVGFLADLAGAGEESYLQPLVKSEESEIIVRLGFPIERLYAPVYLRFIESVAGDMTRREMADGAISPAGLLFRLDYMPRDNSLGAQRITLSSKELRLEPRKGRPVTDQIYYSKAPLDTDTHIKLLEELEKTIVQAE